MDDHGALHVQVSRARTQTPTQIGDRDYILGLMLMGIDSIQSEGQERIARQMRHLVMTWYTDPGLRRGDLRSAASARREAQAAR